MAGVSPANLNSRSRHSRLDTAGLRRSRNAQREHPIPKDFARARRSPDAFSYRRFIGVLFPQILKKVLTSFRVSG